MKRGKNFLLLIAILLNTAILNAEITRDCRKVNVFIDVPDSISKWVEFYIDDALYSRGENNISFSLCEDQLVHLEIKNIEGYLDYSQMINFNDNKNFYDLTKELEVDLAYAASILAYNIVNKSIGIEIEKDKVSHDDLVRRIKYYIGEYFGNIDINDNVSSWWRTAWVIDRFQNIIIRSRLEIKEVPDNGDGMLRFILRLESQYSDKILGETDEDFRVWPRLMRKYSKCLPDIQSIIDESVKIFASQSTSPVISTIEQPISKISKEMANNTFEKRKASMVDVNIPETKATNPNTFVIIFANEDYKNVASVPFAKNDGSVFQQYCQKTLGIPVNNIHYVENASFNDIRIQLAWLNDVCNAFDGNASLIVYYAGHGIPDEKSKSAYLLPVDGDGRYVQSAYKLDDMYQKLGAMSAKSVIVFMDACFSGSKREEGMLASARGVAVRAKAGAPQGNMVVFSAATGDETAYPNNDEQHGMFTYYLLKKLQETKGDVTLQDLGDYITTNVRQQSIVKNGKSQTPTVTPSAEASTWQTWKLK